ncbi:hypothetical protein E5161_20110 [Cohnella pontilimi]|uniref:Glycosyltransferase RgtA/B/C/D-like domain-containing protein n=1 Tax=Cohnella pontilimi TaxID=2564100 RepID=A0A4U0F292_9BACL|nr:hypothetical protein [Cohnella pontilimi]TJY38597.1 hypothetical protein E5161_20110 [Cohnella pontilimi]
MFHKFKDIRAVIAWITVILAAGLAVYLLMIPPIKGVADNGDFGRLMRITGFQYLDPNESYSDRYFGYAHQYYTYGGYWGAGYVTTQVLLLAVTGWIARIFNSHVFDIRWLGVMYTLLWSSALYLFIRHVPNVSNRKITTGFVAVTAAVSALFVFGDMAYLAYFQSFFGEPYALIGMLLAIGSAVALTSKDEPSGKLLALFILSALAVTTSKIQYGPLGFAFALLAWRMMALRADRRWHRQVLSGIGALLLCSVLMIVAAPSGLKHINLYQSIFYGVLKDSHDLSKDMKELGIPEKYAGLAGTNYFQKNTVIPQNDTMLREEVLSRLGHRDIALYYLKHPARFVEKLEKAAANGMFIRPYYLGNYDQSAGKPRGAINLTFSGWSEWKVHRMPHTLGWYLGFYFIYFIVLAVCWRRTRSIRTRIALEAYAAVGIAGAFAAVVPIIGDGEADLGKHLFMFNVCFDMMVVSALTGLAYGIARWTPSIRAS